MKPEDIERVKDLLPTTLGSDEVRAHFAADILRRSVFSARMAAAHYLADDRAQIFTDMGRPRKR